MFGRKGQFYAITGALLFFIACVISGIVIGFIPSTVQYSGALIIFGACGCMCLTVFMGQGQNRGLKNNPDHSNIIIDNYSHHAHACHGNDNDC